MAVESIDDLDWRLLEALQQDGRASYADLGRLVGLSPSAVTERVRRLEESGVITGYRCEVDPEKLGLAIMALVGCATRTATTGRSATCSPPRPKSPRPTTSQVRTASC